MGTLFGKTILVAQDDAACAARTADMLVDAGAVVVGPARTLGAALVLAAEEAVDAAVVDVHLDDHWSFRLAEALERVGAACVYTTRRGEAPACAELRDAPLLAKPYDRAALTEALSRAVAAGRPPAPVPAGA